MPSWTVIGAYELGRPLLTWLLTDGKAAIAPYVNAILSDPQGTVSRLGDLIVWNGAGGQRMLAGLECIGDTTARIEQAVAGIETTQLAMQGTLGVVQSVSLATLGVTSLSAAFMAFRLAALDRRLQELNSSVNDINDQIDAGSKAHLMSRFQFLSDHERTGKESALDHALEEARRAVNIYGQLCQAEAMGAKRLPVMNYRSRCYLLGLFAEIECQLWREEDKSALDRIEEESGRLSKIAQAMFAETVANAPEAFLDPALQAEGISLELLTELYRQAQLAGAVSDVDIESAADMFEYLRTRIYQRKSGLWWVWQPTGAAKQNYLAKLRYFLACAEDTNRIGALRLLITECQSQRTNLRSLREQVKTWRSQRRKSGKSRRTAEVLAYAFV